MNTTKKAVVEYSLFAAWAISFIATLGSLFFSEVIGYIPCELCWYQRIVMYPLVVILGIAVVRKDAKQYIYVLPIASIGFVISFYHYLIQKVPAFASNSISCGVIPCTTQYINWAGFITIPFLALSAFTAIIVCCLLIWKYDK
ncbi:disulfide oxidoreductase [Anaerobacillus sp. MEB173]|uniref:disulfide oxidoreductase n=1 Tax=Anaerobacillus sp. MEB173 TaxID=3383345 RepID=UPI003F908504